MVTLAFASCQVYGIWVPCPADSTGTPIYDSYGLNRVGAFRLFFQNLGPLLSGRMMALGSNKMGRLHGKFHVNFENPCQNRREKGARFRKRDLL